MRFRSGIAVALAWAGSYGSDLTPSLGTSICHRYDPKKPKKQQKKDKKIKKIKKKKKKGKSVSICVYVMRLLVFEQSFLHVILTSIIYKHRCGYEVLLTQQTIWPFH